jgi:GH43 family beta-xylosidase
VLQRNGRVFVVYSASASWQPTYKLGMLVLTAGGDPMNPRAWTKLSRPVFESTATTWGVGHCGFTQSPDGTEDWIVYHAKLERRPNWKRAIHAQRFSWDCDGTPVFGAPVSACIGIAGPSGQVLLQPMAVGLGRGALVAAMGEEPMIQGVNITNVRSAAGAV